jgi:hypothetical protein
MNDLESELAENKSGEKSFVESEFAVSLRHWSASLPADSTSTVRDRVLARIPQSSSETRPRRWIVLATAAIALLAVVGWWPRPQAVDSSVTEAPTSLEVPAEEVPANEVPAKNDRTSPQQNRPVPTVVVITLSSGTEVFISLGPTQPTT